MVLLVCIRLLFFAVDYLVFELLVGLSDTRI